MGAPHLAFYEEFAPISDEFIPEAAAISGLDREVLKATGKTPVEGMTAFAKWSSLVSFQGTAQRALPVFTSFSTFDWMYMGWYFQTYLGDYKPYSHSSLELKSYYCGKYNEPFEASSKSNIKKKRPYLFIGAGKHTHNALDDAVEQARFFQNMLKDGTS